MVVYMYTETSPPPKPTLTSYITRIRTHERLQEFGAPVQIIKYNLYIKNLSNLNIFLFNYIALKCELHVICERLIMLKIIICKKWGHFL
jgi:hypothetical protein